MPDALKRIFNENLYPKVKDRNWERRADRCGNEVEDALSDLFKNSEDALLGTIHALASLIMLSKKEKRMVLVERVKDALVDRVMMFQEDEDEEGPGDEEDDEDPEQAESIDDVDFEGPDEAPVRASRSIPERPSPEPTDDDDGPGDEDPNESDFRRNPPAPPTRSAGYQPKPRRPGDR